MSTPLKRVPADARIERKHLQLEVKEIGEDGTFEGLLATYGNVDLGRDLIEKGAFRKTLKDSGGEVPLLWSHHVDEPIGTLQVSDAQDGLQVRGVLDLNVQRAREVYSLIKKRIVKGLSIGFDSVKDSIEEGVRHLKEIRLWEGSIVTFPMNMQALIQSVKGLGERKDFNEEMARMQMMGMPRMMMDALCCALMDVMWDSMEPDKVAASDMIIEQFHSAYVGMMPDYMDMMMKAAMASETKAGRRLSASTMNELQSIMDMHRGAMQRLQALLDDEAGSTTSEDGAAKQQGDEPEAQAIHSALTELKSLSGEFVWQTQ